MKNLNWLTSLLIIIASICCLNKQNLPINQAKIIKEFYKNEGISLENNYGIFVITESGCLNCDQFYLKYIADNFINKSNMYIYSTASGVHIDISPFLSDTITNLLEDEKGKLIKQLKIESSCFMDIVNDKVDTIIIIQAKDIQKSLSFLNEKLLPRE